MFNRKLLALFLLIVFAATLFAGCGSKTADEDNPAETVELVWYTGFSGTESPKDLDSVTAELSKYTKEKINATVKIIPVAFADYQTKMNPILASGEACDLVFTCSWTLDYRIYGTKGLFYPLDDLLPKYGEKLNSLISKELWEATRVGGKIIAVPNYKDLVYQQVVVFNKNKVDALGLDLSKIKTFADLAPVFAQAHAKDPGLICFETGSRISPYDKYDFLISYGTPGAVRLDDSSCKVVNQWDYPDFIKDCAIYREFYQKGYISKDTGTTRNQSNPFLKGTALAAVDVLVPNCDTVLSSLYGFPVVSVKLYDKPAMTTHSTTGSMIAVSASSKHPARALRFLELLNTDPYVRNLVTYGIEKVHYDKTGPTSIKYTDKHKQYEMAGFALGNRLIEYTVDPTPPGTNQLLKAFNDSAVISPVMGFSFNTEPVKSEISAIENLNQQYAPAALFGLKDVDEAISDYQTQLKACGVDRVLAEMQKQVDEWKKNKK
ncbi:MAG: ABC transporter substrate-binding protein [Bacillota bacterium]